MQKKTNQATPDKIRDWPGLATITWHIFTLCALAVSHPLYAYLVSGDHATFFVAHQVQSSDIWSFILVFSLALPLAVCAGPLVLWPLSKQAARLAFFTLFYIFVVLILLPFLQPWVSWPGNWSYLLPLAGAVVITAMYIKMKWVQWFVSFLSLVVVVSPLLFISNGSIRALLETSGKTESSLLTQSKRPDIVFIIFDELPLLSLLDDEKNIDAALYPNFHRLAQTSTWHRNALTTHFSTWNAIASLLVGERYSEYSRKVKKPGSSRSALLDRSNAPHNLFSWLEGEYQIFAIESTSKLAPQHESFVQFVPPLKDRMGLLLSDTLVIYGHLVLTGELSRLLPPTAGQWSDFALSRHADTEFSEWKFPTGRGPRAVLQMLRQFQPSASPTLYYLHVLLPHFPFVYSPDGSIQTNHFNFLTEQLRKATGVNNWPSENVANLAWQAHLLQLSFTDMLLGKMISRLQELDLFESSILIVTADHGTSFFWNSQDLPADAMADIQASETLRIPLFVKLPGQNNGSVSDLPVQTTDIIPTIADVLEREIPWNPEGGSLLRRAPDEDRVRIAYAPDRLVYGDDSTAFDRALARKILLFGQSSRDRVYQFGPHPELIGLAARTLPQNSTKAMLELYDLEARPGTGSLNERPPEYLEGKLSDIAGVEYPATMALAIGVNGVILSTAYASDLRVRELVAPDPKTKAGYFGPSGKVGKSDSDNTAYFLLRIQPGSLPSRDDEIEVYIILSGEEGVTLSAPISSSKSDAG